MSYDKPIEHKYTKKHHETLHLPFDKFKGPSPPGTIGMAEGLDEHHRIIGGVLIVVRGLRHKPGGLVFFQFSHRHHLQNGIKISRIAATSKMVLYETKSHAARSLCFTSCD